MPQTTDTPQVLAALEAGSAATSSQLQDTPGTASTTITGEPQPHPMELASQNLPASEKPVNSASAFRGRKLGERGEPRASGTRAATLRAAARGLKPQVVSLGDAAPYFVETDSDGFARFPEGGAEAGLATITDALRGVWSHVKVFATRLFGPETPARAGEGQDSMLAA